MLGALINDAVTMRGDGVWITRLDTCAIFASILKYGFNTTIDIGRTSTREPVLRTVSEQPQGGTDCQIPERKPIVK